MTRPSLTLIWAMAENGIIGRDGQLPWHLPDDLRHFKRVTVGKPVVMGARTWESLDGPLPERENVVLTSKPSRVGSVPGVRVAKSLDAALAMLGSSDEVFVIGGAAVYAAALPLADRLFVTRVHADVIGDVEAPEVDWGDWESVHVVEHGVDVNHDYEFTITEYRRR